MLFFPASLLFVAYAVAGTPHSCACPHTHLTNSLNNFPVPLNSRQTAATFKCSNSTATTDVGSGILGTQFILTEINAL
jgi:hypothetical protein